ncbi:MULTISPECIES: filamentous hemagglutinin N-terminal domain-containing protein [unclassified Leptolyngbya]|uniref:two-partner secretion domain-containing protein n=1 Tax=unclassified Leptolyngbya TaxID=2650499 RepID=UPI00168587EF|nr:MULTISPECIES: filamentous hemagglutinin N-terminal domain-containing protein [unclassified Leptolyngbya]MBD1912505.1 filamentous hemagglutinin N-terminal domain-containing protein [Leptolyngbya sp. FACHB-8]MBD2156484.1 filamentous hemagglutinin N-terminal domain-containing protein [Leptolyngbya sp. FACHB-16]
MSLKKIRAKDGVACGRRFFGLDKLCKFSGLLVVLGGCFFPGTAVIAQLPLEADNTLNNPSQVVPFSPIDFGIVGGDRRGSNLFHSFREFNVSEGGSVYFGTDAGVANILTRVTGGNGSQIRGVLGVVGSNANLFLLNPNGILLGPNAQLDLRGSFLASTAEGFLFANRDNFSASNPQPPGLLSVSAPIGLQYGDRPGNITSYATFLAVDSGRSLVLAGGAVRLDGSSLAFQFPNGGRLELGSVSGAGVLPLRVQGHNLALRPPATGLERGRITMTNGSTLDARAQTQGAIALYGGNINILEGSALLSALTPGSALPDLRGGNITINATGTVRVVGPDTRIVADVQAGARGDAGDITIVAQNLNVLEGVQLNTNMYGAGSAGTVQLIGGDRIRIDNSTVSSQLMDGAVGQGGNVGIAANRLWVVNGAALSSSSFGTGDGGAVQVLVGDRTVIDNSSLNSEVSGNAQGDGGDVSIATGSLRVLNNAQLSATTFSQGDAGDVLIQARDNVLFDQAFAFSRVNRAGVGEGGNVAIVSGSVTVLNGSQLIADSQGRGNAGNVFIQARDRVLFQGTSPNGQLASAAFTDVDPEGVGHSGNIGILANTLELRDRASLTASNASTGDAGSVILGVSDRILLDNAALASELESTGRGQGGNVVIGTGDLTLRNESRVLAQTRGMGNAGNVIIDAENLHVLEGSQVIAQSEGMGNAGFILINARGNVVFDGASADGSFASAAFTRIGETAVGQGGGVFISAESLRVTGGGQLIADTLGTGDAGAVFLQIRGPVQFDGASPNGQLLSGAFTSVAEGANGNGGNVAIQAGSLTLQNGGRLVADTESDGNAGNVIIETQGPLRVIGTNPISGNSSAIFSEGFGNAGGNGGNVIISADSLDIRDGGALAVRAFGSGNAGNIIATVGYLTLTGGNISAESLGTGRGGQIAIAADHLVLDDESTISTQTNSTNGGNIALAVDRALVLRRGSLISTEAGRAEGSGNGGDIFIDADFVVGIPQENSDIVANAFEGSGGNIAIATQGIFGLEYRPELTELSDITASSRFGLDGTVVVDTPGIDPVQGLVALPSGVVDASDQIGQVCPTGPAAAERLGRFVVTGRGGLPPSPLDPLESDEVEAGWVSQDEVRDRPSMPTPEPHSTQPTPAITEAESWVRDAQGNIYLVAGAALGLPSLAERGGTCPQVH